MDRPLLSWPNGSAIGEDKRLLNQVQMENACFVQICMYVKSTSGKINQCFVMYNQISV